MIRDKFDLVNEQTSPLFRIMNIYDANSDAKAFGNNISAFHIGNGLILSVAHNLRTNPQLDRIDEQPFQLQILNRINPNLMGLFNQKYVTEPISGKRYYKEQNPGTNQANLELNIIVSELARIRFDNRWITQVQNNICKQYLVVQFRGDLFYNDSLLTNMFGQFMRFHEPHLNRFTFLIEVELVSAFYENDIAMYKIVNTHKDIIKRLPSIELDFGSLIDEEQKLYCLQSAPVDNLGRLLNDAKTEGILDHWNVFVDPIGGNYIMDGLRYLIKGYFRFGSSGAPYIIFDQVSNTYKAIAVQSEACPIQLSIGGNMQGNSQFINALASPLSSIRQEIEQQLQIEEQLLA